MNRASKQLMGGGRKGGRSAYGCIVSFESEHGAELTLHCTGAPRAGLTHLAHPRLRLGRADKTEERHRRRV